MRPLRIALLGAESTGKTELARALAHHCESLSLKVASVPEWLRLWCDAQGRTPRRDEQRSIAEEQMRRVEQHTDVDVVISDTTPLMTAIYSQMLFDDASLYPMAIQHQRQFDATLVTGLDLPWVADGLQRDGPHVREPVDRLLRLSLAQGGVSFQVVYGSGAERLQHALAALANVEATRHLGNSDRFARASERANWVCEKCADPDCEHRLFSQLLSRRGDSATPH